MTDAAGNIMRMLEPGESLSTGEDVAITFGGREYHVHACIGMLGRDCVLMIGPDRRKADPVRVVRHLLRSACAAAIASSDGDTKTTLAEIAEELADAFEQASAFLAANKPQRGRPT